MNMKDVEAAIGKKGKSTAPINDALEDGRAHNASSATAAVGTLTASIRPTKQWWQQRQKWKDGSGEKQ